MPNLNFGQVLSITIAVLGVLVASTANLTDLFGAYAAKIIVSGSGLLMGVFGAINAVMGGQSSQLKAVQAMPGVEKIVVNEKANATLATLAIDPAQQKIEASPEAEKAVQNTAKNG